MRKLFCIGFLIFNLSGCAPYFDFIWDPPVDEQLPPPVDIAPFIDAIWTYETEMRLGKSYVLQDSSVSYGKDVTKVFLKFYTQDIIELCDARGVIVDIVDEFLGILNNTPGAFEQSKDKSFDYFNVDICIQFGSFFIRYIDPTNIAWVTLKDGMATFYAGDTNSYRLNTWHARTEPFFKTIQIVKSRRNAEERFRAENPHIKDERPGFGHYKDEPENVYINI